jgi:hypothetical protein
MGAVVYHDLSRKDYQQFIKKDYQQLNIDFVLS